ncbi:methyl-accepting chemotaxis protein [uncultured Thalassospira sp.]|jgi:methyl-accepting chemotaxis protein|uniref:methyl-accepting chemotaxis protein n=1 Tax=uncultured Thalassospira sp. TaxID=404382 RepID=UPI0030DB541D|tara:strand:+ start:3121 stop:4680 length:1560 start_codon:yes stop_codon:yes gene_type:complete
MLSKMSMQSRATLTLASAICIVLVIAFGFIFNRFVTLTTDSLTARAQITASLQAGTVAGALWDMNDDRITNVLDAMSRDPDFVSVQIVDKTGTITYKHGTPRETDVISSTADVFYQENGSNENLGSLVLQLSTKGAEQEARSITVIGLGTIIVMVIVMIGVIYMNIRSITRPIKSIIFDIDEIQKKNYDLKIAGLERHDEIGTLAKAVNDFRKNLASAEQLRAEHDREKEQNEMTRKNALRRVADELESSTGKVVSSLTQATISLDTTGDALKSSSTTCYKLVQNANGGAQTAAENVNTVASASEQLSMSITEINQQVAQSVRIAQEAVNEAQNTAGLMDELNKASSQIGDVVNLINEIAGQTNLLALNATIEAARAGDAGKGFAVVAQEVKNLASQTSKATEDISDSVNAMQSRTENAVAAIEKIRKIIGQIDGVSSAIAAAIEQQGAAANEITRSISQAAQGTGIVSTSVTSVLSEVEKGNNAAVDVLQVGISITDLVARLGTSLDSFLQRVRIEAR